MSAEFLQFIRSYGLVADHVIIGKVVRTSTTDKPRHRNGAYQFFGTHGWVQNHATMQNTEIWKPEKYCYADSAKYEAIAKKARIDQAELNRKASAKAGYILKNCVMEQHAYLDDHGFTDALGLVWHKDENNLLVIPMRIGKELVGVQLIDRDGNKKFLHGSRCAGAEYVIDGGGVDIWCEGYCTGLAIRTVTAALKISCRIHTCFSAGNLAKLAKNGFVVADNDASGTGERVAKETGLKYWISDTVGEDFCDYWKRVKTLKAGMEIRKLLTNNF